MLSVYTRELVKKCKLDSGGTRTHDLLLSSADVITIIGAWESTEHTVHTNLRQERARNHQFKFAIPDASNIICYSLGHPLLYKI